VAGLKEIGLLDALVQGPADGLDGGKEAGGVDRGKLPS
jgi:hypothetical protein